MMRCIENAVSGGYVTREAGEALQDRVRGLIREGLASADVRQRMIEDLTREEQQRRRRGLLQEARRVELTQALMTYRNAKGQNDPAEALWLLLENDGRAAIDDVEYRRKVIMARAHADLEDLLHEFRRGALKGDLRRRNAEVKARMDNVVREAFGEDTGDERAKVLAKSWADTAERLRQRFNAAGGDIRKLEGWALPQGHDPEALLQFGQRQWVDYLMGDGVLDRDKMISQTTGARLTDDDLRKALAEVWKKITTDGWITREPSYVPYGKGALAKQADDKHRFLHFKNADAWLTYHRQFKSGDPFEAMMGHISVMSRDIATMEILGPSPERMRNYLKQLVLQHAAEAEPIHRVITDQVDRIATVVRAVAPGEAADRFLGRIKSGLDKLGDLELRLKAGGGDDASLKASAAAAVKDLEDLQRELGEMEPARLQQMRADMQGRLEVVTREIDVVKGKGKAQLRGGLSKRSKRDITALERERADLVARLDEFERGDTSVFGNEPDAWREVVDLMEGVQAEVVKIRADGFRAVVDPQDTARVAISRHDHMWDIIRGTHYAPVHSGWANALQIGRNIMTGALLGSAAITAVSDLAFQRAARKFVGMDNDTMFTIAGMISRIAGDGQREAVRSGLMLDSAIHVMHNQARYVEGMGSAPKGTSSWSEWGVVWSGFIADRVIAASGLSAWTQAGKHAFGMHLQREIAVLLKRGFDDLPDAWKKTVGRHGITAADWAQMQKSDLYRPMADDPEWVFLRPNELSRTAGGEALAEKYLAMVLRETRYAVVEGTVRSRTFLGGSRPGTIVGELARNIGQFKSFGAAVVLLHIGRMVREVQAGNWRDATSYGASLMITGAILGAVVNELYEIINGRDPVLPRLLREGKTPGADYWGAALLKAGGLGIYGDFLFAPVNRFGGGLGQTFMGPVGGQFDRLRSRGIGETIDWYQGKKKKSGVASDLIATAREITPGSTLWYARLLKERWIMNPLQRRFDPDHERMWRRHEKLQKKRLGNDYFWKPGELLPRRGPSLSTAR